MPFLWPPAPAHTCVFVRICWHTHTRCMVFEKLQLLQWGRAGDAEMCQRDDATRSELHLCRARLYCMSQNTYYANPYQMVGLFMHHVITALTVDGCVGRMHRGMVEMCLPSASTNLSFSCLFNQLKCNFSRREQQVPNRRHQNDNKMICSVVWICKQLFSFKIGSVRNPKRLQKWMKDLKVAIPLHIAF